VTGKRWRLTNPRVAWLGGLLAVVLVAWGSVACLNSMLRADGCKTQAVLQLAAAPAISGALAAIASETADPKACYRFEVVSRDSASFADALANPPSTPLPKAWVPESTFWLRRARAKGAFEVADRGTSVATSPVVFAVTEPVALQLGWPEKPVSWSALMSPASTMPVGMPDPATDPVGVSAVIAIRTATASENDPGAANTAALKRISQNTVTRAGELYERLPEAGSGPAVLNAFVSSEQAVLKYNARKQPTHLIAAYPDGQVPTLDFPYVVLPGATDADRAAATQLLNAILAPAGRSALTVNDFRAPDGTFTKNPASPNVAATTGVRTDPIVPVAFPDEDGLVQILTAWTGVQLSARILGVIDVSGSMAERAAGGGETRLAATISAAQQGIGLLRPTTEVGIWLFSTQLDGDRDYRVLAPVRPLSEAKLNLLGALSSVRVKPNGDTGLFDTTLAAYQDARRNWVAGRINVVLIATDGKNDDPQGGISRAQLLTELGKLVDPRRPLPILFIGIGGGVDLSELNDIAKATGGRVYLSKEPSGIKDIFFSALSDLSCQPPACKK